MLRYLDGEATPEERAETERWLDADPARRQRFEAMRRIYESPGATESQPNPAESAQTNWTAIRSQMANAGGDGSPSDRAAARFGGASGRLQSRLALTTLAFTAVLAAGVWLIVALYTATPVEDGVPGTAAAAWATGPDETRQVTLDDGSQLRLDAATTVTQPDPDVRQFVLDGVARFEVAHNPTRPFAVETQYGRAQVLGTTFTVRARQEAGEMAVSVEEGRVAVRSAQADGEIVLTAGEKARAVAEVGPVRLDEAGTPVVALQFEGASLETVADALARAHGIPVVVDGTADQAITADFTGTSLDAALDVLEVFFGVEVEQGEARVVLTPTVF